MPSFIRLVLVPMGYYDGALPTEKRLQNVNAVGYTPDGFDLFSMAYPAAPSEAVTALAVRSSQGEAPPHASSDVADERLEAGVSEVARRQPD